MSLLSEMGSATPSKKRKLNDSKAAAAGRNLDYFFGKQARGSTIRDSVGSGNTDDHGGGASSLADEQLARKLQAEWDQEEATREARIQDTHEADHISRRIEGENRKSISPMESLANEEALDTQLRFQSSSQSKRNNTLSLQSTGSAEDTVSSNVPFDESPLTFDPSKYVSELQGHWAAEAGDASYAILTRCFVLVNSTQSRIRIVDTLVNLLRVIIEGDPDSLLPAVCGIDIAPSCLSQIIASLRLLVSQSFV